LFVVNNQVVQDNTPLHRVASTAREKGSGVRFRGVVSTERYRTDRANGKLVNMLYLDGLK
jgi:hypothetical protein